MKFNIHNRRYTGSKTKLNIWIESSDKHCKNYSSFADIFAGTGSVAAHNINKFKKSFSMIFFFQIKSSILLLAKVVTANLN